MVRPVILLAALAAAAAMAPAAERAAATTFTAEIAEDAEDAQNTFTANSFVVPLPLSPSFSALSAFSAVPNAPTAAADTEPDPQDAAGDNLGRTEADDDAQESDAGQRLGTFGAVEVPLSFEADGQATIALYTPAGQLVRILGQVLELKKGDYRLRWDGLDLFGNLVPAGTDLVLKVITNGGVRAYYEFSVAAPKVLPWGGAVGEGDARRQGGWLGDHSAPNAAVAVGDRVLLGCLVAEHGDNLIAVTLDGEKIWGGKLSGWSGPRLLASDGHTVYALSRHRNLVYRVDPATGKRHEVLSAAPDTVQAMAACGGRLALVLRNHQRDIPPVRYTLDPKQIDFAQSRPQVLETGAPTEFTISPQAAFANTFAGPAGNPQNGARLIPRNQEALLVLVFKGPVEVGTVLLGRMEGIARIEAYALKAGLVFDHEKHSPLRETGDDVLDKFNLPEFDESWERLGETDLARGLNVLTAARAGVRTRALYLKAAPPKGRNLPDRPRLGMARILKERVRRVEGAPVVRRPDGTAEATGPRPAGAWDFRTEQPVSAVYPAEVRLDWGRPQTFDAVALLNCVNPSVHVEASTGDPAADAAAGPDAWTEIAYFKGRYDRRLRYLTASTRDNETVLALGDRVTARALRFRVDEGYRWGKWGGRQDDPFRVACDDVALLERLEYRPPPPSHIFRVADLADGKTLREWRSDDLDIAALASDPSGTLFSIIGRRLCRTEIAEAGPRHTVLSERDLAAPVSLAVSADRIAVGDDRRHAVLLFDRAGRLATVIGERGERARGPWDPRTIERPTAVAVDARGNVWVAEERFAPKRVARFGPDGRFLEEYLGPPMYGGGGCLDPDLGAFYYRSMAFALDWARGTSRLAALNDRLRSEETPVNNASSFTYTSICTPLYYQGRRYVVGDGVVCLLEGAVWRPCAVLGDANHSYFLLAKEGWKRHWARFDLTDKYFLWCDSSDDGRYQPEEVELFDKGENKRLLTNLAFGPDLSLWGTHLRLRPYAFTPSGAPLYRVKDIEPFNYDALAPHYSRNYTLGGSRSAKPHYFGFKYVTAAGRLIQEGQPFIVQPDGTILGGPPPTRPSDYLPPIDGLVQVQPWKFVGGAMTASEVGEIAVVNSNNGPWYVWAADYGCVISSFFTGKTGGWGWGMPAERGQDVTGRKHAWEAWGGHFVKARDGRTYAAAGKGFHAIARIEGLDDFKVRSMPLRVSAESYAVNERLRPILKARHEAMQLASSRSGRKELVVPALGQRAPRFRLDGDLRDWGDVKGMKTIGPAALKQFFDLAYDEKGLYVALGGENRLGGAAEDWRRAFTGGFHLDLMVRADAGHRSREAVPGDRRIVFARHEGRWVAVLYDYVAPDVPRGQEVVFASPLVRTTVGRVVRLGEGEARIAVRQDLLSLNAGDLEGDDLRGFGEAPILPGTTRPAVPRPAGVKLWTAEIFLPWTTLLGESLSVSSRLARPVATLGPKDRAAPTSLRFDLGIADADANGTGVGRRLYWSNTAPAPLGDLGLEAMINPGTWGYLSLR